MNNIMYVTEDEWPVSVDGGVDMDKVKKLLSTGSKTLMKFFNESCDYCGLPDDWRYDIVKESFGYYPAGALMGVPYRFRRDLRNCLKIFGPVRKYNVTFNHVTKNSYESIVSDRHVITIKVK